MKISEIDAHGRWTGRTEDVAEAEGCPRGWRIIEEPAPLGEGEWAVYQGGEWVVTDVPPPEPVPAPLPVPEAVDMRQARLKLLSEPHDGGTRLDAVNAFVATQDERVGIEWTFARELRRDHPLVGIMGFFFGLDSDDLDQWFREAGAIGPTLAA